MKLKKMLSMDFVQKFKDHLETPFEHKLLEASLRNYCSHGNPLRFNNFAFAMRELVTMVLNRKAPVRIVKSAPWYVREHERIEVTRRQQIKYCAQKYIPDALLGGKIISELDNEITKYLEEYTLLNKYTHITEKYFNGEPKVFFERAKELLNLTSNAFEHLDDIGQAIEPYIIMEVQEQVEEITSQAVPDEVETLSQNTIVNGSYVESLKVISIDNNIITVLVEGTLLVERQYKDGEGFFSDSDRYPFLFAVSINTRDFSDITPLLPNITVDTSEWYAVDRENQFLESLLIKRTFLEKIGSGGISASTKEKLFPGITSLPTEPTDIEHIEYYDVASIKDDLMVDFFHEDINSLPF